MRPTRDLRVHFAASIFAVLIAASPHAATPDFLRQGRLMVTAIEFENLVDAVKISGGQVARQEMQGFGQGWSRAQLFWRAPAPVDSPIRNWPHLDAVFEVPADGTYDVVLRHTVAPDFATFRVFLDGRAVSDVDGYAVSVAPRAHVLGSHDLKAGSHQLVVTVFTKAAAATGYAVGLDRLDLRLTTSEAAQAGRQQPERVPVPRTPGSVVGHPPVVNQVTLDAGRRLTNISERRALSRAGLDDVARVSAVRALGGIFANVESVQSTIRWSADAPVIPGRGFIGGENIFLGAPEPLTIAFRVGGDAKVTSNVRLLAKGLQPDLYLLQCSLVVTPGTTLVLQQIGPDKPAPQQVPTSKLVEVTPSTGFYEPYLFLTGFKVPEPGTYAFLLSGKSAGAVQFVEVSFCELSLMK
jgi:hypothetical protein